MMKNQLTICCLLFAILMFQSTAKGELVVLDQASGTSQWSFENFTNVGNPYAQMSLTMRLADPNARFTSVSLDLNSVADIWWRIYNTQPITIQAPDDAYAGFAAYFKVNGTVLQGLSYRTEVTFDTPELDFTGGGYGNEDYFYTTGADLLEKHLTVNLANMSETNELTFTWEVVYSIGTELFDLLPGYNRGWYCGGAQWSLDGEFNIAYESESDSPVHNSSTTPEPATMLMFGLGLFGVPLARHFRKNRIEVTE